MHKQILTKNQIELLPLIKDFKNEFYLVGGTAIALQIRHRRSIDFDLFKPVALRNNVIKKKIKKSSFEFEVIHEDTDELTILINTVKVTFYHYPFIIQHDLNFERIVTIPNLLELSAMKAYALGRRAKWKDYVDFYFIFRKYYKLRQITKRADKIFGNLFSEKLFRQQLCYFKDIDFSEGIDFMDKVIDEKEIKQYLTDKVITDF